MRWSLIGAHVLKYSTNSSTILTFWLAKIPLIEVGQVWQADEDRSHWYVGWVGRKFLIKGYDPKHGPERGGLVDLLWDNGEECYTYGHTLMQKATHVG